MPVFDANQTVLITLALPDQFAATLCGGLCPRISDQRKGQTESVFPSSLQSNSISESATLLFRTFQHKTLIAAQDSNPWNRHR